MGVYIVGHTFSITSKNLPQFHSSQIEFHHAHSRKMRFDVGKWMNSVKLDFPVESDTKKFLKCGHSFSITWNIVPQSHFAQIEPHHAHSRQIRFEVGKSINLVKIDFPVESDKMVFTSWSYIQYHFEEFTSVSLFSDRTAPCAQSSDKVCSREVDELGKTRFPSRI